MYKSLIRTIKHQARSQIIGRNSSSQTKGANGKRKQKGEQMDSRYDFNRRWTPVGDQPPGVDLPKLSTLKLVSYNILAQDLLLEHLFLYVGIPRAAAWLGHRLYQL